MPRTASGIVGSPDALDLAAQAVDLHVDGALVDGAVAGQRAARHGIAARQRQDAQHLALAVGEMDRLLALPQFAALQMIDVGPNATCSSVSTGGGAVRLRILPIRNTSSRGSNGFAT